MKNIMLELREIILNNFTVQQMEAIGKEIDKGYDHNKIAGLSMGMRLRDKNEAARILVDTFASTDKCNQLIIEIIEANNKTVSGQKVKINGIENFLSKLPHHGIVYNRDKGAIETFTGTPESLDNWGILKEGEIYELAFISIDIAGNSHLQEKYNKEDIERVYRSFMEYIRFNLDKFNGKIWNWAGDGGLCAFYLDNKARDAVKSSISILLGMLIFNAHDNDLGEPINIRIAVDRGNANYKTDKGNIYSETINWVCHLEKKSTDPNSISISQEVYEALSEYMKSFFYKAEEFEGKNYFKFYIKDAIGSNGPKKKLFGK
jgi:class 3 adenylate cyclase